MSLDCSTDVLLGDCRKIVPTLGLFKIEPVDWESATGECLPAGSEGVLVQKVTCGQWSTCEWEYNKEHERWDTECDDMISLHAGESPFEYGFKFCPYCGKEVTEFTRFAD